MEPLPHNAAEPADGVSNARGTVREPVAMRARPSDKSDWIFLGSFVAAAAFGVSNAINTIRHGFYESFVKPARTGEKPGRPYDEGHPFGEIFNDRYNAYEDIKQRRKEGKIDWAQYREERVQVTREAEKASNLLLEEMGIPSSGVRGWVQGTMERVKHTGSYTRKAAALTVATTTVITLGALSTLKYSKHLIDLIDGKEGEKQDVVRSVVDAHAHPLVVNANEAPGMVRLSEELRMKEPARG